MVFVDCFYVEYLIEIPLSYIFYEYKDCLEAEQNIKTRLKTLLDLHIVHLFSKHGAVMI